MLYLRHQRVLDVIGTFDGLTHYKDNFPWFHHVSPFLRMR